MQIKKLSKKQLISALGYYNNFIDVKEITFTDWLKDYVSIGLPAHENSPLIIYRDKEHRQQTTVRHGFFFLYESEEKEILEKLSEKEGKN